MEQQPEAEQPASAEQPAELSADSDAAQGTGSVTAGAHSGPHDTTPTQSGASNGMEAPEQFEHQSSSIPAPGQHAAPDVPACSSLAAKVQLRRQQLTHQEQLVLEWQGFAARQAQRYVPAPPSPNKVVLQDSECFRLRLLRVDNLQPPHLGSSAGYGLQLGVSLFDQTVGQFYGSTCYSLVEPLQQQGSEAGPSMETSVEVCFDVFFHTFSPDPRCMAVVELILVELEEDGSCKTKFSAGWAQLPLLVRKPPAFGFTAQLPSGQAPATAPVMSGTPRYLQLRAVSGGQLLPPALLGNCLVAYQVEGYPAMQPAKALLLPDFLLCYMDVIPGLRRFDLSGAATTALKNSLNTLASPVLSPLCSASLAGVQLVVPQLLHNLLSVLPELLGSVPPAELASLLAVPCQPEAVAYALRVRQHNARSFVGPWVTAQLKVQPQLGSLALCPADNKALDIDWLMQDRLVVLILELIATPAAAPSAAADATGAASGAVLVGRCVLAPFTDVAPDGSSAVLDVGRHKLAFSSDGCMGSFCRSSCWAPKACSTGMLAATAGGAPGDLLLPLNWRALLGDSAARSIPDPKMQLELQPAGRDPQLPHTAQAVAAAAAGVAAPVAASMPNSAAAAADAASTVGPAAKLEAQADISPAAAPACHVFASAATSPTAATVVAAAEVPCVSESAAARSLQLAAMHLEEAASVPVVTPSLSMSATQPVPAAADRQAETASQQQLQQLACAMQQQLDLLAQAVSELKKERETLRSSLTLQTCAAATEHPTERPQQQQQHQPVIACSSAAQHSIQAGNSSGGSGSRAGLAAADMEWLAAVPEAAQGDFAAFSGQMLQEPYRGLTPSRAVLQQLHEAGMTRALPPDIRSRLQAYADSSNLSLQQQQQPRLLPQGHNSRMTALLLDVESRDPRTKSDVVLQLLAFRPSGSPRAAMQLRSGLSSIYFTLQFYRSGPVVTCPCLLAAATQPQPQQGAASGASTAGYAPGQSLGTRAYTAGEAAAGTRAGATFMLLPQQPAHNSPGGAGLMLKCQIDGSKPSELLPGQDPLQAAAEAHVAFCKYLASHRLSLDVWDGDSLLQVGSCTTELSGLLRQGRDVSDLLLELPVTQACSQDCVSAAASAGPAAATSCISGQHPQKRIQLGTLVLRLINMGQEPMCPRSASGAGAAADTKTSANSAAGKKVCVRAAPLEPGSPVAKELRGASSPFAVDWQQQQQSGGGAGAAADGSLISDGGADTAATAADIINLEQRKLAREQCLRELLHSPTHSPKRSSPGALQWQSSPGQRSPAGKLGAAAGGTWSHHSPTKLQQREQQWRPGSPLSTLTGADGAFDAAEPFKALQQQLLSDVDAVRKRQKPGFIRSQLRKNLVTQFTIRTSAGQALLLQHTLVNSMGRDAVFELRVSHPQELVPVESLQELKDLQQSLGGSISTAAGAGAAGHQLPQAAAGIAGGDASPLKLRQLAQAAAAGAASAACPGRQLACRGRVFVAANECVHIPFRFTLQCQCSTDCTLGSSSCGTQQHDQQQQQLLLQQQHLVTVEFVPLGLDHPVGILELQVRPNPAAVDRTLRYHCPEREVLLVELPLQDLPGVSAALLDAAAAGKLAVAASMQDVAVSLLTRQQAVAVGQQGVAQQGQPGQALQQQQLVVCLRYRCGAAQQAVQFFIWLYGDAAMAQPLETWQAFVHSLQRVDMRATVGQQSSTTLAVAGGSADRLVAAYTSQPEELQASPATLMLPASGLSALGLVFKPRMPGQQQVRVHLVDVNTRQLVHALIVCTGAQLPALHRTMEVVVRAGSVSQQQLEIANTSSRQATYTATTNTPWLLAISPAGAFQVPAGGRRTLDLVCDARALTPNDSLSGVVFISDEQQRLQYDDCVLVHVRAE